MSRLLRAVHWRTHLTEKIGPDPVLMQAYGRMFVEDMERGARRAAELRAAALTVEDPDFEVQTEQ